MDHTTLVNYLVCISSAFEVVMYHVQYYICNYHSRLGLSPCYKMHNSITLTNKWHCSVVVRDVA